MANPDLPQDMLLEIFSRTPTKCVGKCRTLSKSSNTHLSANTFLNKHLVTRNQTIQQHNLALTSVFDMLITITHPTRHDEVFNDNSFFDWLHPGPSHWCTVLGSCNGLILISGLELVLANPTTLKHVIVPSFSNFDHVYGFGYDSCSDDYKIVRLSLYSPEDVELCNTFVDVYSVKTGVWKRLYGCYSGELVQRRFKLQGGGAFLNGALHWLICSEEGYRSRIAAFDLSNKVFHDVPLPKEFVRQKYALDSSIIVWGKTNGVSVVGGCLLIVDNFGDGKTDVWIMREYGVVESWVKFHIECKDALYKWDWIVATLCYVEDGVLLCLTNRSFEVAYDLKGGTVRRVVLGGRSDTVFVHGMSFVDSLVSPERSSLKNG